MHNILSKAPLTTDEDWIEFITQLEEVCKLSKNNKEVTKAGVAFENYIETLHNLSDEFKKQYNVNKIITERIIKDEINNNISS